MKRTLLLPLLALAACATVPTAASTGPSAPLGQFAAIGAAHVQPLSLVEDSRCPAEVQCVWAGRLRINALIRYDGFSEEQRREMTLGEPIELPVGKLTLASVAPAPRAGEAIAPGAYRFTFSLTR